MTVCGCWSSPFPCLRGTFEAVTPSQQTTSENDALLLLRKVDSSIGLVDETSRTRDSDNSSVFHEKDDGVQSAVLAVSEEEAPGSARSPAVVVTAPLNDTSPSAAVRRCWTNNENTMTLRRNPKMRLLTTSSTVSSDDLMPETTLSADNNSDEETSEWSMTSLVPESSSSSSPPLDVGLMISIDDERCQFHLVPDANYPGIHPNVYAPASLSDMKILYGGGSGVSVFGGHHPQMGDVVMKHGGYKDAQELFALATISEELNRRGKLVLGQTASSSSAAASNMQERLPSFQMVYISPNHIMDRGKELMKVLKTFARDWSLTSIPSVSSISMIAAGTNPQLRRAAVITQERQPQLEVGMKIRIFEGEEQDTPSFVLNTKNSNQQSLSLVLPAGSTDAVTTNCIQVRGNAYECLTSVAKGLTRIMTERMFKFTLAQRTIGGPNPKTGNQWLYEGKLSGAILKNLMDQMIHVIRDLQKLTMPEEVNVVKLIREEVKRFEQDDTGLRADDISPTADAFVGNAIKKNFHPEKGRQRFLREICSQFRDNSLLLMPEEEFPAKHLGMLLRSGALMSDTFLNAPMEPTVLQIHPHSWRNILRRAVESRSSMSKAALQRIWTCGLTDAGIHNLFVNETDLYFFDLGEPQLMSLPGFLTKFLFSFFHTLGMEDDGNGSWVRRFVVVGDKLALSKEAQALLPKAYDAFEECLDRIVSELLDNDRQMRWLLLEYITMQLLSDTAFCLQKWQVKGGGKTREGNHQMNQEKWLWRALWDIYVAFDINTADSWYRFDVEHPHFRESLRSNMMESFSDSCSVGTMKSMMTSIRTSDRLDDINLKWLPEDQEDTEVGTSSDEEEYPSGGNRRTTSTSTMEGLPGA